MDTERAIQFSILEMILSKQRKSGRVPSGSGVQEDGVDDSVEDAGMQSSSITCQYAYADDAESDGEEAIAEIGLPSVLSPCKCDSKPIYRLTAVILHKSEEAGSGHYVTAIRQEDETWILYNDSDASRKSRKEAIGGNNRRDGYLYFYEYVY